MPQSLGTDTYPRDMIMQMRIASYFGKVASRNLRAASAAEVFEHNKVSHRTVLLVRVVTENIPRVPGADRVQARELGSGFWQIEAHFGFAQTCAENPGLSCRGTRSSNPSPSSGESCANLKTTSTFWCRVPPRFVEGLP